MKSNTHRIATLPPPLGVQHAASGIDDNAVQYAEGHAIFLQGDASAHVMYIRSGEVELSVVSKPGVDGVATMLGPGAFFGEECLVGRPLRAGSARTVTPTILLLFSKSDMLRLLRRRHGIADRLITQMLTRTMRIEEDLTDRLFAFADAHRDEAGRRSGALGPDQRTRIRGFRRVVA